MRSTLSAVLSCALSAGGLSSMAVAQVAVRGERVYPMTTPDAPVISPGVVLIGADGKIQRVGSAAEVAVPAGWKVVEAKVVTPGLIDARSTVGLSGLLNQKQDQDQLETSGAIQPELRAIDAFNPADPLVAWVRSLGVTTLHTGHAPGELMSGQTCLVKTSGLGVDTALLRETAAVAATIGPDARRDGSPGTRAKMVSMLREQLIRAQEYVDKAKAAAAKEPKGEPPARDLRLEVLARVLSGEVPLVVTAQRAQDIATALRLADEFHLKMILDGGAESYLLIDEIKKAGVPVLIHPPMTRAYGDMENASMTTPAVLTKAGIPVAFEAGFEGYVPKTRVVLFEAGVAVGHGMRFEDALASLTCRSAQILGVQDRVGSLKAGMDGDVALFDGDPFEYTTHCTGTIIDGRVVNEGAR